MLNFFKSQKALFGLTICCFFFQTSNAQTGYKKTSDGILITLPENGGFVKLQVVTATIIHVTASPDKEPAASKSLMVINPPAETVKWDIVSMNNVISLQTDSINANIVLATGAVTFTDKMGNPVLQEKKNGGKLFVAAVEEGEPSYQLKQIFESPADEAFYGLGQHQSGVMNYKGRQVDLSQNNTEVAIPFLVSNKNYGILWDNYSITKVVDSRDFEPISSLKLFAPDGSMGWLTATYASKNKNSTTVPIIRAESTVDYEFINAMKNFPKGFLPGEGIVSWEGFIQSSFTGIHSFQFKYAGYAKLWLDGKLLCDRWRQCWNPGTALLEVDITPNKKHALKIEWIPDGGESYISLKWMKPLEGDEKNQFSFRSEAGDQIDYYFIYGKTMDEIIGGYRQLTGKATILPKWAYGFWQSRERYKTQDEILTTVSEFRKRKIPLDNIVLDWSYWEQDKWGSQQFDTTRFPDAAAMIKTLHEKYNTRFMISVWPKFYEGIDNYKLLDKNGWLYKRNIANRQRDWIAKGYVSTFYDAFNPKAREAFWDMMNKNIYVKGVDAWWMDATEPDIYSNSPIDQRKEQMRGIFLGPSSKYFNAFPLQNARGVYEGQRKTNPGARVFILTRSAFGGMQRYAAATWSGDIASRWEDFKTQIPAGINFSMSGLPYWTSDIGGFAVEKRYENAKGKELDEWQEQMTRWYQYGAFCPLFRVHGQFPYREIFNTAKETDTAYQSMLYYDKLRYRLMPYIYSLAGKVYVDNYTLMRGLVMDFPNDKNVINISDQYMFGPSLLISPVYEYKARKRNLYLPQGNGWYNFYTGQYVTGGQTIAADAPLDKMPLFVKEGSIIPVGPALQYTAEKLADSITLFVYTGKDASFTLYEDEDLNYNYEKGAYATIAIEYNETAKTITIDERKGSFNGMLKNRVFNIVWVNKTRQTSFNPVQRPSTTVKYSGKKVAVKMK